MSNLRQLVARFIGSGTTPLVSTTKLLHSTTPAARTKAPPPSATTTVAPPKASTATSQPPTKSPTNAPTRKPRPTLEVSTFEKETTPPKPTKAASTTTSLPTTQRPGLKEIL